MNADHPVISHPTFLSSSLMLLKKVTIIPNNPPDNVTTTSANFLKDSLRMVESCLNLSWWSSVIFLGFLKFSAERLAHPRRGGKPEFEQDRYSPLDGAYCSLIK